MAGCAIAAALALPGTLDAAAPRTLTIATYALPPAEGNAFSGTGIPNILTWSAMFESLTVMSPEGRLEPQLATHWQLLDPLTWRFTLRQGVAFSNGEPFDADAVLFAIAYVTQGAGRTGPVGRDLAMVERATAVDSHTIDVRTKTPYPLLPEMISVLRMVPPRYFSRVGAGAFARAPVGTGPYQVDRWEGPHVWLSANPRAWRRARLDQLEIIELPDAASRVQAVQSGRVQLALQMNPDDTEPLAEVGARLETRPGGSVLTLHFITTKASPLTDVRVRRALNMAVDRERIIGVLFRGATAPASQPASKDAFGYDPTLKPWPYDPAAARRLLAEAGYPDGFDMTAEVVIGGGANDSMIYQSIAAELAKVGVRLTIRTIPTSMLLRRVYEGSWRGEAFGMDYGAYPTLDALRPFRLHSCLWPKPWYCDPSVVPLIEAARTEFDRDRRLALTREVVRRAREEASSLLLYEVVSFDALADGVRGYRNAFGTIDYGSLDYVPPARRRSARTQTDSVRRPGPRATIIASRAPEAPAP